MRMAPAPSVHPITMAPPVISSALPLWASGHAMVMDTAVTESVGTEGALATTVMEVSSASTPVQWLPTQRVALVGSVLKAHVYVTLNGP